MPEQEKIIANQKWILNSETRWTRVYRSADNRKSFFHESKFSDGTAAITLEELAKSWPDWREGEQCDFSNSLCGLQSPDLPEILRYLKNHADAGILSNIALLIAHDLPPEEAVPFLVEQCEKSKPGHGSNFFQALAKTNYPSKIPFLKQHLQKLIQQPDCWNKGAGYFNDVANQVVYRLRDLIDLGEPKEQFQPIYNRLKEHPHDLTREITTGFLSKKFES
jgi:hypothetical protein